MAATSRLESGGEAGAVHLSATCRQLVEARERDAQWAPGPGLEVGTGGAAGSGTKRSPPAGVTLRGARELLKSTGPPCKRVPCVQPIVASSVRLLSRQPANVVHQILVSQVKGGPLASFLYRL